ncbi:hypothetical protein PVA44_07035 (plasmid) [Entomospira nematocerorum]|uniref:Uncharacterized protein n=1 Tax=Entomospira nematocerorum TaxID=2719987 RepID=A0A968GIC5_9SPIO|nr:hypothetical protein [Entomospira nematocera]NIZ47661.1 hypothetical protein [Entomospira nematocera]WDI34553.1 hypothetical protein PVA44_07035 [Entomospira nematocera]
MLLAFIWSVAATAIFSTTPEEEAESEATLATSDDTQRATTHADDPFTGADFDWFWYQGSDVSRMEDSLFAYIRREEPLVVPSEMALQRWSQWGALYAKLRRENRLHLVDGIWSEDALVQALNSLVTISEEELETLALTFTQELWSQRSTAFFELFFPILQQYFAEEWPTQLESVSDLEQWWQAIAWPSTWMSRSIMDEEEWQIAIHQQEQWELILQEYHEEIRRFLHESMSIMTQQMSASIVYAWLYQPASVWEMYTRQDAIQIIYALYMSFYEVLQLWYEQSFAPYIAYIQGLPFDEEEKSSYVEQLQGNMEGLLDLFYDQRSYHTFIRERNRWMFRNNQRHIAQYQEELMQLYAWLWTSQERRTAAKEAYWQAYLEEEEVVVSLVEQAE